MNNKAGPVATTGDMWRPWKFRERDEARTLAFGRACHAEACRIANDEPSP